MMKGTADNSKKTVSMVEQYALAVPFEVPALAAAGRSGGPGATGGGGGSSLSVSVASLTLDGTIRAASAEE